MKKLERDLIIFLSSHQFDELKSLINIYKRLDVKLSTEFLNVVSEYLNQIYENN